VLAQPAAVTAAIAKTTDKRFMNLVSSFDSFHANLRRPMRREKFNSAAPL
jgi:hypothetical protein